MMPVSSSSQVAYVFAYVGMFALAFTALILLLIAVGLVRDVITEWRQRRARVRYSREAVRMALQRKADQAARFRAGHGLTVRADEARMWEQIESWPELRQGQS